jgi:predicted DNA-binding ArsR family transcriptional regulator
MLSNPPLSDEEIYQQIGAIVINFKLLQCEVRGKVFDNLSTTGLTREEWIEDFDCPSGQFTVEEIDSF